MNTECCDSVICTDKQELNTAEEKLDLEEIDAVRVSMAMQLINGKSDIFRQKPEPGKKFPNGFANAKLKNNDKYLVREVKNRDIIFGKAFGSLDNDLAIGVLDFMRSGILDEFLKIFGYNYQYYDEGNTDYGISPEEFRQKAEKMREQGYDFSEYKARDARINQLFKEMADDIIEAHKDIEKKHSGGKDGCADADSCDNSCCDDRLIKAYEKARKKIRNSLTRVI